MNSEEKPNPRHELEDLIEQQGGHSLENCNLEFLGYQQGLKGEIPHFSPQRRSVKLKSLPHQGLNLVFAPAETRQSVVRVSADIKIN